MVNCEQGRVDFRGGERSAVEAMKAELRVDASLMAVEAKAGIRRRVASRK